MAEGQRKMKGKDNWQSIMTRAAKDAGFRQRLLTDPKAAIENELGIKLPANVKVKVHEQTAAELHLVLPAVSAPAQSRELTNAELENAAGGMARRVAIGETSMVCGPF